MDNVPDLCGFLPNYMGGYSDHFPVYVYLLKEV